MSARFCNLREFLDATKARGDLVEISCPVDPVLELPEIHRRVISQSGKALLFTNVRGSPFAVATNLFGTPERVNLAFGEDPVRLIEKIATLPHELMPPTPQKMWHHRSELWKLLQLGTHWSRRAPVLQCQLDLSPGAGLELLPALKQWPLDGGRFLTLPLVYTEHPDTGAHNLGMYRIQLFDHNTTGMHIQIHRGAGFQYHAAAQKNRGLPATIFLGGPPALTLAAIAPLPENVPELLFASLVLGKKIARTRTSRAPHPLISEAEFAIVGEIPPHERRQEGPFGDHFGYYSLAHDYPIFRVSEIYHRKNAIFPATVVGKPRQEDFFIGNYLQRLMMPLIRLALPGVVDLRSCGETGFHGLAVAKVKERYWREAMTNAFRILGEGQLSLQKVLMVTEGDINLDDFPALLQHFLKRTNWRTDFFVISNTSQDTLDYSGPRVNEGSKAIWLALGEEQRELCTQIPADLPSFVQQAGLFVPGCLVVQAPSWKEQPKLAQELAAHPACHAFQIVLMVDSISEALSSSEKLMWTWFTRFEPAADIFSPAVDLVRFHPALTPPLVFDCRMKPWYPDTVEPLPETENLVSSRWREYFSSHSSL